MVLPTEQAIGATAPQDGEQDFPRFSHLRSIMDSFRGALQNYPSEFSDQRDTAFGSILEAYDNQMLADQRDVYDSYLALLSVPIARLNHALRGDREYPFWSKALDRLNSPGIYLQLISGEAVTLELPVYDAGHYFANAEYLRTTPDKTRAWFTNTRFAVTEDADSNKFTKSITLQLKPKADVAVTE